MSKNEEETKQIKWTPELQKKMYAFSVASEGIMVTYTPETDDDVPDELIPSFKLKTLSVSEIKDIKSNSNYTDEDYNELLRSHLIGWSNLYDISTGNIVRYVGDKKGCDGELYNELPDSLKILLTQYLIKASVA